MSRRGYRSLTEYEQTACRRASSSRPSASNFEFAPRTNAFTRAHTLSAARFSKFPMRFSCTDTHRKHRASRMRKIHNKRVVKIADDRDIAQSCIVASEGSDQIDFEPPVAGYRSIVINIRRIRRISKDVENLESRQSAVIYRGYGSR